MPIFFNRLMYFGILGGTLLSLTLCEAISLNAQEIPAFSMEEGIHSTSPLLNPGNIDFLYTDLPDRKQYNFLVWSPFLRGGMGLQDFPQQRPTHYMGGFIRPLLRSPQMGELIIGAQWVDAQNDSHGVEAQAEYRFPFGLGIGGGFANERLRNTDINFGKMTYRGTSLLSYIFEIQYQFVNKRVYPGGYIALYTDELMAVYGNDGEQWRATFGYIAPDTEDLYRPALEVLFVDNTTGQFVAGVTEIAVSKTLFIDWSLGFDGRFLTHASRLGRAMGPQGLEFGNPLGFLDPTWNRRLQVWELGHLLNGRILRNELPNGSIDEKYETLGFPFQFIEGDNLMDYLFVGGFYRKKPGVDTPGIIGGFSGDFNFLKISVGTEYEVNTKDLSVIVGLIDQF